MVNSQVTRSTSSIPTLSAAQQDQLFQLELQSKQLELNGKAQALANDQAYHEARLKALTPRQTPRRDEDDDPEEEPVPHDAPPTRFLQSSGEELSTPLRNLLWFGLAPQTRRGYDAATKSYTSFCAVRGELLWLAQELVLGEWLAAKIYGGQERHMGRIKPATASVYLSALRSYQVDRRMDTQVFSNEWLKRIIKGGYTAFPNVKRPRYPITKDVLTQVTTSLTPESLDDLNITTAFKVAWAAFMRLGEITYTTAQRRHITFHQTRLIRSDISFASDLSYAILRLKTSKTDIQHSRVEIMLAASGEATCPFTALRLLFERDPSQPHTPSFAYKADNSTLQQSFTP